MSKLPIVSPAQMAKVLSHLGFELIRQKGSHAYFRHPDKRVTVVPMHRGQDLHRGLIRSILRDIELPPEKFKKLLRQI